MERAQIRLECLKLAASRTSNHQETIARFKEYFELVTEPGDEKKTDNATQGAGLTVGKDRQPARP